MQNNERKHNNTKGYYILLAALALVAGISGYIFLSDAEPTADMPRPELSVPVETAVPDDTEGKTTTEAPAEGEKTVPTLGMPERTVMPVSGDMLQPYAMESLSYNTTTRDWRVHGGVDLSAELGQDVRAARSGTVMAVYEDDYYGMTVVLQHKDGYTTSYCGLAAEPSVAAGEDVTAGQVLGQIGGTALIETAMEDHLHFEVCKDGEPIDPAGFLYS
ncbi:MAG: M23 family metallopeptidase [Oscillospiraceae bacterium]|nr:M23 family metallopeptidase [Oscillospiraceae bacterium]